MTTTSTPTVDLSDRPVATLLICYAMIAMIALVTPRLVGPAAGSGEAPTWTLTATCPDGTTWTVDLAVADDRTVTLVDDLDDSCTP